MIVRPSEMPRECCKFVKVTPWVDDEVDRVSKTPGDPSYLLNVRQLRTVCMGK